jgi:hypothetical protein
MPRPLLVTISLLVLSLPAFAQAQAREHRSLFYGVGGVGVGVGGGASGGTFQLGFGGEGLITQSVGMGGEISYLGAFEGIRNGIGIASVTGGYHFEGTGSGRRVVPFASGGYSLLFRSGSTSGVNFGGGVNYWMKDRVGLRFEVRDYVFPLDGVANVVSVRVGILFR